MFELFLNPWFMVAGGILVSAPIIIHLINRMRFRRIRWAAMEFLLKSQKRNRRRLIIEQLILLALRCFLVLLLGFLVARFIGLSWAFVTGPQSTIHVLVIDNTLSMTDRWKDRNGNTRTSFDQAKEVVKEKIARNAAQASSAQTLRVYLLTDLDQAVFEERLNDETIRKLADVLDKENRSCKEATEMHVPPLKAVQKAKEVFADPAFRSHKKVFHFVSDFRERDWNKEANKELHDELEALAGKDRETDVYLVDVADPNRGDAAKDPTNHDNIGIKDFRPQVSVAAESEPITFLVTIQNFTDKRFENLFLTVHVNGVHNVAGSMLLQNIPRGESTHRFQIGFNKEGYNLVTATLDDPKEWKDIGLRGDNIRHCYVRMQKNVIIPVIDGDYQNLNADRSRRKASDAPDNTGIFYLSKVLGTTPGYVMEPWKVDELRDPALFQYPCIYLLNVPEIKDKALENLEKYVREGGSVCFFLGDKVKPGEYNRFLYNNGKGVFPAPLEPRPTEEKVADVDKFTRIFLKERNLFVRTPDHPMFASVREEDRDDKVGPFFMFVNIDRYYRVDHKNWEKGEETQELFVMPNRNALNAYAAEALALLNKLGDVMDEEKYRDYRSGLERHRNALMQGVTRNYTQLYELSTGIYNMLHDTGRKYSPDKPNEPERPDLTEFWSKADKLRKDFNNFSERVRFGDPLMIGKPYGKGKVVACMTTAGTGPSNNKWNDWPDGLGAPSYVVYMPALRQYLFSVTEPMSAPVGTPIQLQLDANQYEGKARLYRQPEVAPEKAGQDSDDEDARELKSGLELVEKLDIAAKGDKLSLDLKGPRQSGLYILKLFPQAVDGGPAPPRERRAYVYDVDTMAEGELRRAKKDILERPATAAGGAGKITVFHSLSDFSVLANRQTDVSESPWLYLLFLVVLIVEQALAVHLSFHTRPGDVHAPAPARVPA